MCSVFLVCTISSQWTTNSICILLDIQTSDVMPSSQLSQIDQREGDKWRHTIYGYQVSTYGALSENRFGTNHSPFLLQPQRIKCYLFSHTRLAFSLQLWFYPSVHTPKGSRTSSRPYWFRPMWSDVVRRFGYTMRMTKTLLQCSFPSGLGN